MIYYVLVDSPNRLDCLGRYCNDPRFDYHVNAKLVYDPGDGNVYLIATVDIAPGEEIFISYGDLYWLYHDKNNI